MRPSRSILVPLDLAYAQLLPVRFYDASQSGGVLALKIEASEPAVALVARILGPVWVIDWAYSSAIVLATVNPYWSTVKLPNPI